MTKSANPAMTDPAPSVQPVRAWAVVGTDNVLKWNRVYPDEKRARLDCALLYSKIWPDNAPHRVIRVEIREVNDE